MTKEELNQLQDLRLEIKELDAEIERLRSKESKIVTDKVMASSREFPYIQTSVKITGIDQQEERKQRKRLTPKITLLMERRQQVEKLELKITQYINTVADSKIRRMMEYKYVKGYTWEKIGRLLHCDRTTAEKAVSKYLREHP